MKFRKRLQTCWFFYNIAENYWKFLDMMNDCDDFFNGFREPNKFPFSSSTTCEPEIEQYFNVFIIYGFTLSYK